ncbi:hypothetical protein GCM10010401_15780 [Rarobacter faecitabidus]|uniref:Uncharacterized protein YkwD n=2 Tax=Rarobacter faecitabidus TaxID=13243 RepID=A0A542ZXT1_RARFA|nr:uncharacterized protein YkwD [Rarobacter faecitabidus]
MRTWELSGGRVARSLGALALALALILGVTCVTSTSAVALSNSDGRARLLKELNDLLVKQGLRPLTPSPALTSVAQKWTAQQYRQNTLAHNPKVGSLIPKNWRSWGENVGWALGYANNAVTIHQGWVDSPGHYANMTASKFTHVGIGYVEGKNGAYATQVFATYPGSSSPAVKSVKPKKVKAGKTVRITIKGRSLGGVTRVKIGGRQAKIVKKSSKKLVVRVKLPAGKLQVRVRTGLGWSAATSKSRVTVR